MGWRRRVVGAGVGYAVAGPGGALVGGLLSGGGREGDGEAWHDLSDVPFGVNAEMVTSEDDGSGRRWTLAFLSEIPSPAVALVQLRDDAGKLVAGRAPFADPSGRFAASAPIDEGRAVIYAPFGTAVPEPKASVSLEVAVFRVGDRVTPVGRATLDGELPGEAMDLAGYLAPVVALATEVAGEELDDEALARLGEALGVPASEAKALKDVAPPAWSEALTMLRFRFPSMDAAAWRELVVEVLGDDSLEDGAASRVEELLGG